MDNYHTLLERIAIALEGIDKTITQYTEGRAGRSKEIADVITELWNSPIPMPSRGVRFGDGVQGDD